MIKKMLYNWDGPDRGEGSSELVHYLNMRIQALETELKRLKNA